MLWLIVLSIISCTSIAFSLRMRPMCLVHQQIGLPKCISIARVRNLPTRSFMLHAVSEATGSGRIGYQNAFQRCQFKFMRENQFFSLYGNDSSIVDDNSENANNVVGATIGSPSGKLVDMLRALGDVTDHDKHPKIAAKNASSFRKPILDQTSFTESEKKWFIPIYNNTANIRHDYNFSNIDGVQEEILEHWSAEAEASPWRVVITAAVTNATDNRIALDTAEKVFLYIQNATNNDPRIRYELQCFYDAAGQELPSLRGILQMWLDSYNTYHLIDGLAMKTAYGGVLPDLILDEKNLAKIVEKVRWSLFEDESNGALLTPRMSKLRFRGGAGKMNGGINTDNPVSDFSVISHKHVESNG